MSRASSAVCAACRAGIMICVAAAPLLVRLFGRRQQPRGLVERLRRVPSAPADARQFHRVPRLARSSGAPGSSGLIFSRAASWFIRYVPRLSSSYLAWIISTLPLVPSRTTFSMTTTSLGCVTAKYGSAVTIRPNACSSVVTFTLASSSSTLHFAEVGRAPFGRDRPQDVRQVFRAELRGGAELVELRLDLDVALLAGDRASPARCGQQRRAGEVDLRVAAARP